MSIHDVKYGETPYGPAAPELLGVMQSDKIDVWVEPSR